MVFDPNFKKRNILARQQWKILDNAKKDGRPMTERQALNIALAQQKAAGNIKWNTLYLSEEWQAYSQFSSEERAMYRRSKESGRPMSQYMYVNGRAVLRPEFKYKKH